MKHDVIIIGHALAGLSCALCLLKKNPSLQVALVGPVPSFALSTAKADRQIALNEASLALLDEWGVKGSLDPQDICYYDRMRVWDAGSDAVIEFTAAEVARSNLGAIVSLNALMEIMSKRLSASANVTLYQQQAIACRQQEAIWQIDLSTQITLEAPLVIGADGVRSWLANQAGFKASIKPYHQVALVATLQTEKKHCHTAYQRFLPQGPLALLPLADPHQCSMVWSMSELQAQEIQTWDFKRIEARLAQDFDHHLGAIALKTALGQFPLICKRLSHIVKPGLALVGDAAHVIHPLAGQGANLGLYDVQLLASLIEKGQSENRPLGSLHVLNRYQHLSQVQSHQLGRLMTMINQLFSNDQSGLQLLRGLGLKAVHRLEPVKKACIEVALGNTFQSR